MTAPILDPEHGVWCCPDDGLALRLVHVDGRPLTFACEGCGRVWDVVPTERVTS